MFVEDDSAASYHRGLENMFSEQHPWHNTCHKYPGSICLRGDI